VATQRKNTNASPLTKLTGKHYSPLIIRKYTKWGFPLFVALITDDDLSDLDDQVLRFMDSQCPYGDVKGIQDVRDLAGALTDFLTSYYNKVEGAGVVVYADKMFVSSLFGDFMTHLQCKYELYSLLQMSTGV